MKNITTLEECISPLFVSWLLYGVQLLTIKAIKVCSLFDNCIFILGENKYILEASENWEKRKKIKMTVFWIVKSK